MADNSNTVRLDRLTQTAFARRDRAAEQAMSDPERRQVPREEVEGTSTSAPRSRLSRAFSSRDNEEALKEVQVPPHKEVFVYAPEEVPVLTSVHVTPT